MLTTRPPKPLYDPVGTCADGLCNFRLQQCLIAKFDRSEVSHLPRMTTNIHEQFSHVFISA
jgi:hypothetical protein